MQSKGCSPPAIPSYPMAADPHSMASPNCQDVLTIQSLYSRWNVSRAMAATSCFSASTGAMRALSAG